MSEFTVLKVDDLSTLVDVLDTHESVVVNFGAPSWCVPCRQLTPHYHYVAEATPEVMFVEVDIDESPEIADVYNVMSVPTVRLYEHGAYVKDITGRTAITILKEL